MDLKTKISFGIGDLAGAVPANIIVFYLLFFFTDIAGLNPSLAGSILLIARAWDAINDPLIGWLSDRTKSPLGKRYPWMIFGAIPLGLFFALLWFIPPTDNQSTLFIYYTVVTLLFYTAFTGVVLPNATLAAELTEKYNERTNLITFKSFFSIGGSIFALILARVIFGIVNDPAQRFLTLGIIGAAIAVISVYICFLGTKTEYFAKQALKKKSKPIEKKTKLSIKKQIKLLVTNRPFLYVMGIYLCSWLGTQLIAGIMPYFVIYWMKLPQYHFTQMALVTQFTALIMVFFWNIISNRFGKKQTYLIGIPFMIFAQIGFFLLQPDRIALLYVLSVILGIGIATAYLVPWSMLPDVVDLDRLYSGENREGIFYGFMVQLQKIGLALALFLVGKSLDWSGFISTNFQDSIATQPDSAIFVIRSIISIVPTILLIIGLFLAYRYPLTRSLHAKILLKLNKKKLE